MWDKYLDKSLEITEDTSFGEKPVIGFNGHGPSNSIVFGFL